MPFENWERTDNQPHSVAVYCRHGSCQKWIERIGLVEQCIRFERIQSASNANAMETPPSVGMPATQDGTREAHACEGNPACRCRVSTQQERNCS